MSKKGTILAIVHHQYEDVGLVGRILTAAGFEFDIRNRMKGDSLPRLANGYAGAVVLGGAMSANDVHLEGIRDELDWLEDAMATGRPLLGICLGSQLIARAAGAKVAKHSEALWEIGYCRVEPVERGERDAFSELPDRLYQWHQDGFEVPSGAVLLARGTMFPNQAFRLGKSVYAVQFHPEVTSELHEAWMASSPDFEGLPGAQSANAQRADLKRHYRSIEAWLARFLGHWIGVQEGA